MKSSYFQTHCVGNRESRTSPPRKDPAPSSSQTSSQKAVMLNSLLSRPSSQVHDPQGSLVSGLKDSLPQPQPHKLAPYPHQGLLSAWLSEDGDYKGPGRGLINVSSYANRLSSATSYYSTSPPQPPSLAGLRLSTAPGTRHQIGVKIPSESVICCHGWC